MTFERKYLLNRVGTFEDDDKTVKMVYKNKLNQTIEISHLKNKEERDVICVPSHYFCALGCEMCYMTQFKTQPMIQIRIDELCEAIIRTLVSEPFGLDNKRTNKKDILISFMGVGELILYLGNIQLMETIKLKLSPYYQNIGFAVATMMPNKEKVETFMEDVIRAKIPTKIHFSLHTTVDDERKKLIPHSNVDLPTALKLLSNYRIKLYHSGELLQEYMKMHTIPDGVEIHYTLIDGVNDSKNELSNMEKIGVDYAIPYKFITFNPINTLRRSDNLNEWVDYLKNKFKYLKIKVYNPPGANIGASCGQFTEYFYSNEMTDSFQKWKEKYEIEIND